ncbi:SDR family NAD(P)-dependent oxidoreductase [Enemella evansiae]|uniref:SDR family NAD(P)-dependent oxidoreductase n=1 Tax=Enemella evansiae TaxID=2016499 RepID=UPI00105CFD9F|nr:SDR family NAD(P)-dependent oxidoreductase [Enemella evansiae]TDO87943.1 3-oxoacyl-[acyl-carrier protein] reductase [Enemella evansiae]
MNRTLDGRTALITGGGVGIGLAIAQELADRGARVAITYRTHRPDDAVLTGLREACGQQVLALPVDVTDPDQVDELAETIRTEFGTLDVLVNNVGGLIKRATIAEMDLQLWRAVLATNLDSTYLVTHAMLPFLRRPGGRIVNMASLAGRNGGHPGATAYATSKAALFGFTRGLAKELAPEQITVNAVAPGFIEDTPFHSTFTSEDSKRQTVATIPTGRAGVPADVAQAVGWLTEEGAGFVTGTIVDINGGQYFG